MKTFSTCRYTDLCQYLDHFSRSLKVVWQVQKIVVDETKLKSLNICSSNTCSFFLKWTSPHALVVDMLCRFPYNVYFFWRILVISIMLKINYVYKLSKGYLIVWKSFKTYNPFSSQISGNNFYFYSPVFVFKWVASQ